MQKRRIYLDHSATSPLNIKAFEAMKPLLGSGFGNASSVHSFGQEAKKHLENAREKLAKLINAGSPEEIIFTSGGTESDNLALKGVALAYMNNGNHIITSSIEHHAVLSSCQYLQKNGFQVTYVNVDESGEVDPEDIRKAIRKDTILVSIMHANNEVGTIQPIREIAAIIAEKNKERAKNDQGKIYFHSDAVQTAGKISVDVVSLGVDLLSISGHKFYGPKGIGALYRKSGTKLVPMMHGGHHERDWRAGTENVATIVGMVKALEISISDQEKEGKRLAFLRDKLEKGIMMKIPFLKVNGHADKRLSGISNISFQFIEGESLVISLDMKGIACSTGSACASSSIEVSHVLKAMSVDPVIAQGAVRFSLGKENTGKDIDYVLSVLPSIVKRLREISPLWKNNEISK